MNNLGTVVEYELPEIQGPRANVNSQIIGHSLIELLSLE